MAPLQFNSRKRQSAEIKKLSIFGEFNSEKKLLIIKRKNYFETLIYKIKPTYGRRKQRRLGSLIYEGI